MKPKSNSKRSIHPIVDASILQRIKFKKWYRLACSIIVATACLSSTPKKDHKPSKQRSKKEKTELKHEEKPGSLELSSFDQILKRYLFIGDFSENQTREISLVQERYSGDTHINLLPKHLISIFPRKR